MQEINATKSRISLTFSNFDNIDTIIEPCCGTSALSYYISLQHPKKFKYILNDLNKQLIELYTIMKDKAKCKKYQKL